MSNRNFTKVEAFDFFNGQGANGRVATPQPILEITKFPVEQELHRYMPSRVKRSMIVQRFKGQSKDFVHQHLTGKWDRQMRLLAKDLNLIHEGKGSERIIDRNIKSEHNIFGVDEDWKIKSWEVVANINENDPQEGRLIDNIIWEKHVKGKVVKSDSSSYQWRIYLP